MYIVCSPSFHYRIHRSLPVFSNLNQIHYIYSRPILILSSPLCIDLPSCLHPSGFPFTTLYEFIFYACYMPCQSVFYHVNIVASNIWRPVQIVRLIIMQFFHSTLFSDTQILCRFLSWRDQQTSRQEANDFELSGTSSRDFRNAFCS